MNDPNERADPETQDPPVGGGGGKQAGFPLVAASGPSVAGAESQTTTEPEKLKEGYPIMASVPDADIVEPERAGTEDHTPNGGN